MDEVDAIANLLIEHGYLILFTWVLLDQLALPVPALPMVLAAGALAGEGHLNLWVCFAIVILGCLPANFLWYRLGVSRGNKVLTLLCMISLEPDTCVNSTTSLFHRYGTATLLISKFVPGLQTIAPPLAGLLGIRAWRFVLLSALGSLLYAAAFLLPGYWAHGLISDVARVIGDYGALGAGLIVFLVGIWLTWKLGQRQLFIRSLRSNRVTPQALHEQLLQGDRTQVADLRQRMEFNAYPYTIPGAVRVPLDVFDERVASLSTERPLVLFCT